MQIEQPNWRQLQKALTVEAEHGFINLKGKEKLFSQFLNESLNNPPKNLPIGEQKRWYNMAAAYAKYSELDIDERQNLIEDTRRFLQQQERIYEKNIRGETEKILKEEREESKYNRNGELNIQNYLTAVNGKDITPELPLSKLQGIGPRNAERLAKLGLYTVNDLLFYYPRAHIDYARQVKIAELEPGETVTIVGTVKRSNCFTSPKNKKLTILEIVLTDKTGKIKISRYYAGRLSSRAWQEQQKRTYSVGAVVAASGLVKRNEYGIFLENPQLEVLDKTGEINSIKVGRVVPVYPLTEGVGAEVVRRAAIAAIPAVKHLKDTLPDGLRKRYGLISLPEAIANIHFPIDNNILEEARRRLIFDEFFYLQLGLLKRRHNLRQRQNAAPLTSQGKLINQFYEILPFKLTNAQQRVINEIIEDLKKPEPMNRLVQGDVGSGKTVVAVVAILAAIQSGYQAALMAPTEVLAEQHYKKLVSWLNLLNIPVELLTGSTSAAKRRQIYNQIETGELPVLVGTHALIQDPVKFHRLGLVVIDEQHRFGVEQRAKLQQKGIDGVPHVLTMTATPIPRTLALTLHGDLDVSQIDEMPPGRKPIQTTVLSAKDRNHAYDLIRREIAKGHQAYVVLPLVEESEKLDLKSALEEYQRLQEVIFPEFNVGLLHGRMSSAQKEDAIAQFRNGKTHILVATTVVEVGVDVPNATVMLIENAERFGLSQLHQLRGRVGRGGEKSYCLLMLNSKATADARQRVNILAQSQDGFFIAEMDMRLRGPGEVLGTRQAGLPDFAFASLVEHQDVLILARDAAEKVIEKDPTLKSWPLMKAELARRHEKLMGGAVWT